MMPLSILVSTVVGFILGGSSSVSSSMDITPKSETKSTHICGYDFTGNSAYSVASISEDVKSNFERKITVFLKANLKSSDNLVFTFYCAESRKGFYEAQQAIKEERGQGIVTPEEIIKNEDSGGRYYRNVVWQKEVYGKNWSGLAAFVDHNTGDGEATDLNEYLICDGQRFIPCFTVSFENRHKKIGTKVHTAVLRVIQSLAYEDIKFP